MKELGGGQFELRAKPTPSLHRSGVSRALSVSQFTPIKATVARQGDKHRITFELPASF